MVPVLLVYVHRCLFRVERICSHLSGVHSLTEFLPVVNAYLQCIWWGLCGGSLA